MSDDAPNESSESAAEQTVRLSIPYDHDDSATYFEKIARLLSAPDTHLYIDTSFLMWSTKIGPASRAELLIWLRDVLGERAHVPTWAAHEYLRHHVAGTIVDELSKKTKEVTKLAGRTFNYFRPFLDDPALPASDGYDRIRAATREAINTLGRLADASNKWKNAYADHSREIIEFINERVIPAGALFERLSLIGSVGAARYEGRIPPGYQDRNKKGQDADDSDDASLPGANRYGDLIFWKETLDHASKAGAAAIIVLTNDRKNDWRMGGSAQPSIDREMRDQKKSWRPVPVIHPMLALEASIAGIPETALIDCEYLAAYLRRIDAERIGSFADVAIVPDPPASPRPKEQRRTIGNDVQAPAANPVSAILADDGFRFPDDPAVKSNVRSLTSALLKSRDGPDQRGAEILATARAGVEGSVRFADLITEDLLAGMDHVSLASLSRDLHDRVLAGEPGYEDATVDLVGLLEELPTATASALYLGLLASMYLENGGGTARLPPESPVARMLVDQMKRPFADVPVRVIAKRLASNDRRPLFIPGEEAVELRFDVETEGGEADQLHSLKVNDVQLLVEEQPNAELRLRELMSADRVTASDVMDLVSQQFGLPRDLLTSDADHDAEFLISEGIGFREPSQISRVKDEEE